MEIIIRNKEFKDIEPCVKVTTKAWQQTYKGIVDDSFLENLSNNEADRIKKQQESFNPSENDTLVLEIDKKIVGFVKYGKAEVESFGEVGEIIVLYILDGYKSLGAGKKLFLGAMKKLVEQGYDKAIVGCLDGNKSNEFYKHMGGNFIKNRPFLKSGLNLIENVYLYENIKEMTM